jgi:short-subunit dehydrogenase
MTDPSLGAALVMGVLSGIGAIYADRLARRGSTLILVARNKARLSAISGPLANETGQAVKGLTADLSRNAKCTKAEATLPA